MNPLRFFLPLSLSLFLSFSATAALAAQHPEKVAALRAKLITWRQDVGAVMPTPNPNFDPNAKPEPAGAKKNAKKKSP